MWNFAGRQNDIQGNGEKEHGNWITGISFIDNAMYGDQSMLPDELKANKGHNVFYCLPLLLGLIGLFWQAYRGQKGIRQFWVVFFLFFMTGLAIVLYLNQTPQQPRERDYAYAGSFYAFAIWCGLGVAGILDLIKQKFNKDNVALAALVSIASLLVPIQMASQTWDDHDRSNRYTCRDFGQNYLMSLQEKSHPILFTNGDNDTFPLWYNQEVEGVGTDARVCNLSYLQTDWYIDQMKRPAYKSPSVPITWPRLDFCSGTNEYVEINAEAKQQVLDFYKENPEAAKAQFGDEPFELKNILKYWVRSKDANMHFIPTDTVYVTIDKEAVKQSAEAYDQILDKIKAVTDRIPDPEMTEKINQIESITREIFRAVEQAPEKRGKIDRFMSYFLPTTLKLLESYANLEKTNIDGKNINQSMRSIEIAMDTVVDGFRHQLDELYKSDAVSIETEVDVLTKMINRETVTTRQEFGLGGQAVQTAPQQKSQKD